MSLSQNNKKQKCIVTTTLFLLIFIMLMAVYGCNRQSNKDEYDALQSCEESFAEIKETQDRDFNEKIQGDIEFLQDFENRMRQIEQQ